MLYFVLDEQTHSIDGLGIRITSPPKIAPAKRVVDHINVDYREGSLTLKKGWEDVCFGMRVALIGSGLTARYAALLPVLADAKTIWFSGDSSVYYKIKHIEAGAPIKTMGRLHEVELEFTCAPFRYMRNVQMVTLTSAGSVTNPGTAYSQPRLTVYGTGQRTLTVAGKQIGLNILSGHLVIDSELLECHYGNVAQNGHMTGGFPVFAVGSTPISWQSGITKVEIEPRWRFL
jgi:phage-related protein